MSSGPTLKEDTSKKSQKNKTKTTSTKEKSVNKPKIKTQTPITYSPKQEPKNRNLSNREPKSAAKISKNPTTKDSKKNPKKSDFTSPTVNNISELSDSQISDIKGRSKIYKEVNKTTKEHIDLKKKHI